MDVEKPQRQALIAALGTEFVCFEEVTLRHPTFRNHTVRADVVAIPNDERLAGYALAFEVKQPKPTWSMIDWCEAIKQASDYVYAAIEPGQRGLDSYLKYRISASFLFPAPPYDRFGLRHNGRDVIRESEIVALSGALHLALHLRVGTAYWRESNARKILNLSLGPNPVWQGEIGFKPSCIGLMTGKRSIGSRKIDILNELTGKSHQ